MSDNEVLLTEEGYEKLEDELKHLKEVKRKEVAEKIKVARDFGDISENAEYDEAKNEQAFIEGRIKKLENMLDKAEVVKQDEINDHTVNVGNSVELEELDNGEVYEYTLVGSAEADPLNHKISNESPIGQSVIGKSIGDEVEVETPEDTVRYRIISIRT
ncbi:transcription elongation factor GreA [Halarsenatibacter silvermanii]|uniref:Transcription elongation factor GreA n=1 Tax=Halarsenatibacter silvermanii TaxID=321763 RepID=A0A1G9SWJ8_9FIRM|nr:transcription elongation factor GreA [Halarsenatibacter silvermanii]SDM39816.1 transcription elongation factor GreA [Halarsenatibacter silvermanii]